MDAEHEVQQLLHVEVELVRHLFEVLAGLTEIVRDTLRVHRQRKTIGELISNYPKSNNPIHRYGYCKPM